MEHQSSRSKGCLNCCIVDSEDLESDPPVTCTVYPTSMVTSDNQMSWPSSSMFSVTLTFYNCTQCNRDLTYEYKSRPHLFET